MLKFSRASIYRGIISSEEVNHLYDQSGPTPRLCIDFLFEPLERKAHDDHVRKAISEITSQKLEKLFDESSGRPVSQNVSSVARIGTT